MSIENREWKTLDKIADTVDKLDEHMADLDTEEGRAGQFANDQRAVHDMRKIIRESNKLDKLEDKREKRELDAAEEDQYQEAYYLRKIDRSFDDLDAAMDKLGSTGSRLRAFIEQRKAIHHVKQLLNAAGKYDDYQADEMNHLLNLV